MALFVKRDHCTALWAVQHPSMTPTDLHVVQLRGRPCLVNLCSLKDACMVCLIYLT